MNCRIFLLLLAGVLLCQPCWAINECNELIATMQFTLQTIATESHAADVEGQGLGSSDFMYLRRAIEAGADLLIANPQDGSSNSTEDLNGMSVSYFLSLIETFQSTKSVGFMSPATRLVLEETQLNLSARCVPADSRPRLHRSRTISEVREENPVPPFGENPQEVH